MSLILVYTTFSSEDEAKQIINILLENKLIACANLFPINSFFYWNNSIQSSKEFGCYLKSTDKKFEAIIKTIQKHHSYEIPCILKMDIEANNLFKEWIENEVE